MPIVVVILGVIIIIMGVAFFLIPRPADEAALPPPVATEENNRTETMEIAEEQTVETEPLPSITPGTITLQENVTYLTPARTEHQLAVTMTVDNNNIVTDVNVVYDETNGFSNGHQERFDGLYKAEVIGKPLSEISLSRVGGASLTTDAFNEAVRNMLEPQVN